MPRFAQFWRSLADESQLRWIGPHKGAVHLALASISAALVDLWATVQERPLWQLMLEMTPEQLLAWTDLAYLTDMVTPAEALELLSSGRTNDWQQHELMTLGYPAYNTSVGWLGYELDDVLAKCRAAVAAGFRALKMKVGSPRLEDDVRRVTAVREAVGPDVKLSIDANQRFSVDEAIRTGRALEDANLYWFEEPTHPDDILGYQRIAAGVTPLRLASGECVSNAVLFKNLIQARGIHFVQADVVRLGGLPEWLGVMLMAKKAGLPVAPHGGGDMGHMHQHLVAWQAMALGMEVCPLEHIPHVNEHFAYPAQISHGRYQLPTQPGASLTMVDTWDPKIMDVRD
jgi:L-fuconate dehydratase